jgi:hypothetical protein
MQVKNMEKNFFSLVRAFTKAEGQHKKAQSRVISKKK